MASVRFSDLIILVVSREKTDQGKGLDTTVCMDCVGWVGQMFYRVAVISNGNGQVHRQNYLGDTQRREEQGGV
jgi:hypothetical protein